MIRIHLDEAQQAQLVSLRRSALPPRVRDRLEMVLLSQAGWSPPRIAQHLNCFPQTVRNLLHDFQQRGSAAFYPAKTGPAPDTARRERILGLLRSWLAEDRTWTAAQLADALRPQGIDVGGRQVRRYLKLFKARYRRTASTLHHKQDPAKVQRAKVTLHSLKKKPRPAA
jgi:transposase